MDNIQSGAPSATSTASAATPQTISPNQPSPSQPTTPERNSQPNNFSTPTPTTPNQTPELKTGDNGSLTPEGQEPKTPTEQIAQELFKLKVDGVEEELPRDEVIRRAQIYSAADKRFQEAAKMRQESEALLTGLLENPKAILTHEALKARGFDVRKFAEEYLYEELQREQMSPEQRQAQEEKAELERFRKADQERRQVEEQKTREAIRNKYAADIEKEIVTNLQTSGLPISNETVGRMAYYLKKYADSGIKNPPMDLVVDAVRKDYQAMVKRLFSQSDPNTLTSLLGNDVVEKIRKADLEKLKAGVPSVPAKPTETATAGSQSQPKKRYISMDEARAEIERKLNS